MPFLQPLWRQPGALIFLRELIAFFHLTKLALQGSREIGPGHDQALDIHFEPGILQIACDGLCLILAVLSLLEHNNKILIFAYEACW
jgi:hypothetical protein